LCLKGTLAQLRAFPDGDDATPVILMGYLNPRLPHGLEAFAADAAAAGVDGMIVVDCPPEEADPLAAALESQGLSLIRLATPTTDENRLPVVVRGTSGFVYYVSVAGVTGVKEADAAAVAPQVERVRKGSGLPVAVGFGVRTPERAAQVARVADAVVVGSALVDEIAAAVERNVQPAAKVLETARALAQAVREARVMKASV
jgi:tryptophan synthase alpha chain